jgi:hypothetical protein
MIDADCRLRRLRGCVAAAAAAAARAPADADATASQPAAGPRPPRPPAAQPCQLIGQGRPPPPGDWRQADGAKYRGMLACDGCGGCSRPASPQVWQRGRIVGHHLQRAPMAGDVADERLHDHNALQLHGISGPGHHRRLGNCRFCKLRIPDLCVGGCLRWCQANASCVQGSQPQP